MIFRKLKFKSLFLKCVVSFLFISVILLFVITAIFPTVFYYIMKPYFNNSITGLMSGSAAKTSYILAYTNRSVYSFPYYESIHELLTEYYNQEDNEATKQQLNDSYEFKSYKQNEVMEDFGIISYIPRNMILATDRGDFFYQEELQECAEAIADSNWFREFKQYEMIPESELPPQLASAERGVYAPVFQAECEGEMTEFFCLISEYEVGDVICYPILVTNFTDYVQQWAELTNLGLDDWAILGLDDRILYQNLGANESNIDLNVVKGMEGKQYEVLMQEDKNGMYYSVLCSFPAENFRLVIHAQPNVLLKPYTSAYWIILIFFFIVLAVFLILISWTLKRILSRLTKLSATMKKAKNGDYSVELTDRSDDEIGNLTQTFNTMVARMQYHIENTIEQEKRERQIQYNLMVSAIDPHFIYNTLNTVTYLADQGKNEEIAMVNQALIEILKDRLKTSTNRSFDKVKNEIHIIQKYIYIQNHLCHNTTELIIDVTEEAEDLFIPKNILQPLVENSLLHGILLQPKDKIGAGKIGITIAKKENGILIKISDNGIGMEQDTIHKFFVKGEYEDNSEKNGIEHIGIYNVRRRLDYLYQGRCQIYVDSVYGEGTEIKILLPEY